MNFAKAIKLFLSVAGVVPFEAILKALRSLKRKPKGLDAGLDLVEKLSADEAASLAAETKALAEQVKASAADGKLDAAEAIALAESAIRLSQHAKTATR